MVRTKLDPPKRRVVENENIAPVNYRLDAQAERAPVVTSVSDTIFLSSP